MIVAVAGMYRSGSTFAFNVTRDALLKRGSVHQSTSSQILEETSSATTDHVLFKVHALDSASLSMCLSGNIRVICTVRDPVAAVASALEVFPWTEEEAVERLRQWVQLYQQLRSVAFSIDYTYLDKHPFLTTWHIGRYLIPNFGAREAWATARRHSKASVKAATDDMARTAKGVRDIGFSWYNEATLYHRRHVSSVRTRRVDLRLSEQQIARISASLAAEIKDLASLRKRD